MEWMAQMLQMNSLLETYCNSCNIYPKNSISLLGVLGEDQELPIELDISLKKFMTSLAVSWAEADANAAN